MNEEEIDEWDRYETGPFCPHWRDLGCCDECDVDEAIARRLEPIREPLRRGLAVLEADHDRWQRAKGHDRLSEDFVRYRRWLAVHSLANGETAQTCEADR